MVKAEDFRLKGPGSGLVRFSCCVLKQDTLPTQCLFLPRNTIDNSKLSKKTGEKATGQPYNRLFAVFRNRKSLLCSKQCLP